MRLSRALLCALPLLAAAVTGCTSANVSNTSRTAKEQLLISNAIDQSLNKVDFNAFRGAKVYLDSQYIDSVDKNYLVAATRHRLLTAGAILSPAAEGADVVLEARSGGVGTDTADAYLGIPEITLPGMLTMPEVRLITKSSQSATAKLGFVAYSPTSNSTLGDGGVALSQSDDNNWFVFGVGPLQNGSVRKEVEYSLKQGPLTAMHSHPTTVAFQSPPPEMVRAPNLFQLTGAEVEATKE